MGAAALCPHTNTRFFQNAAPDEVWLDGDLELLARCDAVLMTEDWERSSGARAEHEHATKRQMPVFYTLGAVKAWLESSAPPCLVCGKPTPTTSTQVQVCGPCLVA